MPWNNQGGGGGGWKSGGSGGGGSGGGGGPWGQGGGNQPPDLEDMLKRSQDRMKQVMDGGGLPGPILLLAAAFGCAFSTRVRDSTLRRLGFAHSCQICALVSDSRNEAPRPDGARLSTVTMAVDPSPISTGLPVASLRFNSSASVSPVT